MKLPYLTLLGVTLLGNVFVFGQGRKLDSLHFSGPGLEFGQTLPGYIKPPMVFKLMPGKPYSPGRSRKDQLLIAGDSVRIMSPDRMPCLVTDLSRIEAMPVQRQRNPEPMPNGAIRKH